VAPNAPQLTSTELDEHLHHNLDRLRRAGEVVWVDALDGWLTLSHAAATAVLRDDQTFTVDDPRFSTARVIGPSMLSTDGDDHRRHRAPFPELFSRDRVRGNLAAWTAERATHHVGRARATDARELRRAVCGPLATEVIVQALDLQADAERVLDIYRTIVLAVSELTPAGRVPAPASDAFDELCSIVISSADREVLREPAAALDEPALVSNTAVALFGAIETTEGAMANALHHLEVHCGGSIPTGTQLDRFVEESMRVEPAASVVHRYATADTTLFNASVREGDFVIVSLSAANHDPAVFENPHSFDAARANTTRHLTFATGPHVCFGAHLARMEVTSLLHALQPHSPLTIETDPPRGLVFRKSDRCVVRWAAP